MKIEKSLDACLGVIYSKKDRREIIRTGGTRNFYINTMQEAGGVCKS